MSSSRGTQISSNQPDEAASESQDLQRVDQTQQNSGAVGLLVEYTETSITATSLAPIAENLPPKHEIGHHSPVLNDFFIHPSFPALT
jgi:hypothetical protein